MKDQNATPVRPGRPLAPREHGAYGQLGLPLAVALGSGRPGLASAALTAGAILAFVAHEPLLVVLGVRGKRAAREHGARARRVLGVLAAGAAALGAVGIVAAPPSARSAAAVALGLAAALFVMVLRGAERSTAGELLAGAALASAGVPVAIAAGVPPSIAWGSWAVWAISLGAATLAVRRVIAEARRPTPLVARGAGPVSLAVGLALAVALGALPGALALAAAPILALASILAAKPPHPRELRRIGWRLVGSTVATGAMLVAAARFG